MTVKSFIYSLFSPKGLGFGFFLWFAVPVHGQVYERMRTAEDVLRANIEQTGGEKAWDKVESLRWDAELLRPGENTSIGNRISVYRYPGYRFVENTLHGEEQIQKWTFVITPERSWVEAPDGVSDIPRQDLPSLFGAKEESIILENRRFQTQSLSTGKFNGLRAYCVTVSIGGRQMKRFYDRETLHLIGVENEVEETTVRTLYSDYRTVEYGLQIPFRFETILPDGSVQAYQITRVNLNGGAAESLFRHPLQ